MKNIDPSKNGRAVENYSSLDGKLNLTIGNNISGIVVENNNDINLNTNSDIVLENNNFGVNKLAENNNNLFNLLLPNNFINSPGKADELNIKTKRSPTKKPFDILIHSFEVLEVLYGSLLGDGFAQKRSNTTRFNFQQCGKHKEYILWLHEFFSSKGYCSKLLPEVIIGKRKSIVTGENLSNIKFNTYSYSSFNWIYNSWYKINNEGKFIKIIPDNIESFLSPRALAIWIMDDGTKENSGTTLCTDCFKLEDIERLRSILKDKYNLDTSIHLKNKKYHRIYIFKKYLNNLRDIVLPYFHSSMLYKLGL